jgi:hypothetical protein
VQIRSPEHFGNRRFQKERLAKAEGGNEPYPGVGNGGLVGRGPGAVFTAVGEMKLVEQTGADRCEQVAVDRLNFGGALDAVGGIAVCGDVKRLVGIFSVVEIVRDGEGVLRRDGPIQTAETGAVANGVVHRIALGIVECCLVKIQ